MHFQGAKLFGKASGTPGALLSYCSRCSPTVSFVSCRLDVPKIRLQGYEVSLYRLVPDLEAFSAKLTKLILFYLFFCPRSTPVHDLWFGLTKLNRIARWVQCASYVVWCATSDQSHATWCLRRFIRRSLQMEKKQVRLFFCWTATLIRGYF